MRRFLPFAEVGCDWLVRSKAADRHPRDIGRLAEAAIRADL